METIVITGGTGLIGTHLSKMLVSKGYRVIILTRKQKPSEGNIFYAEWDIRKSVIDEKAFAQADHIIHLAGAGVADKRWTNKRKAEIVSSRVESSQLLVRSIREIPNKIKTVISASAIGWYGPDSEKNAKAFVETDPPATDFLGKTCRVWEENIQPVTALGKRLVILRTGIVLTNDGGAFPELTKPMKAGVAGILGDGKQVISWIHIDDMCRLYLMAIENTNMEGPYNAVAPEPVTNKELTLSAAKAKKSPFIAVHVPRFVLKIMLGEMSIEVLKSTTVNGNKTKNAGFNFLYPSFESALNDLIKD